MSGLEFAALGNGEGRYIGGRGDGGGCLMEHSLRTVGVSQALPYRSCVHLG